MLFSSPLGTLSATRPEGMSDIEFLCLRLPNPPAVPRINIVGFGILEIARQSILDFPDPGYFIMRILDAASLALAPLRRYMEMIEVVWALKDCMEAVKDSLLPPSPKPIIDCLSNLVEKLARIASFFPPLSYVQTGMDIAKIVIDFIDYLLDTLAMLDAKISEYKAAIQAGLDLGDLELVDIQDCATGDLHAITLNMLTPLKLVIPVFNAIFDPLLRFIPNEQLKGELKKVLSATKTLQDIEDTLLGSDAPPVMETLMAPLAVLRNAAVVGYNVMAPVIGASPSMKVRDMPDFTNF